MSLVVEFGSYENPSNLGGFLDGNVSHVAEDLADGVATGCSGLEFDHDDLAVSILRSYVDEARSNGALVTAVSDVQPRLKLFDAVAKRSL